MIITQKSPRIWSIVKRFHGYRDFHVMGILFYCEKSNICLVSENVGHLRCLKKRKRNNLIIIIMKVCQKSTSLSRKVFEETRMCLKVSD